MNRSSFVAAIKTKAEFSESWKQKGDYEDLRSELPPFIIDKFPSCLLYTSDAADD